MSMFVFIWVLSPQWATELLQLLLILRPFWGYFYIHIQGVPPICLQLRTKSWKLKNHICQKISPVLKSLNKKLLDGILKLGKIKFKVFLNWMSKKGVKSEKWFCTLPPQLKMPPAPLPPGKKKVFCTLPPQMIMPPAPLYTVSKMAKYCQEIKIFFKTKLSG